MVTTKCTQIILDQKEVKIRLKSKQTKVVLFSEIKKAHLEVGPLPLIYKLAFPALSMGLLSAAVLTKNLEAFLLLPFAILIGITLWEMNKYKRFKMIIKLKNGHKIIQSVATHSKQEAITLVNGIRVRLL